jgi:hypothetical protein
MFDADHNFKIAWEFYFNEIWKIIQDTMGFEGLEATTLHSDLTIKSTNVLLSLKSLGQRFQVTPGDAFSKQPNSYWKCYGTMRSNFHMLTAKVLDLPESKKAKVKIRLKSMGVLIMLYLCAFESSKQPWYPIVQPRRVETFAPSWKFRKKNQEYKRVEQADVEKIRPVNFCTLALSLFGEEVDVYFEHSKELNLFSRDAGIEYSETEQTTLYLAFSHLNVAGMKADSSRLVCYLSKVPEVEKTLAKPEICWQGACAMAKLVEFKTGCTASADPTEGQLKECEAADCDNAVGPFQRNGSGCSRHNICGSCILQGCKDYYQFLQKNLHKKVKRSDRFIIEESFDQKDEGAGPSVLFLYTPRLYCVKCKEELNDDYRELESMSQDTDDEKRRYDTKHALIIAKVRDFRCSEQFEGCLRKACNMARGADGQPFLDFETLQNQHLIKQVQYATDSKYSTETGEHNAIVEPEPWFDQRMKLVLPLLKSHHHCPACGTPGEVNLNECGKLLCENCGCVFCAFCMVTTKQLRVNCIYHHVAHCEQNPLHGTGAISNFGYIIPKYVARKLDQQRDATLTSYQQDCRDFIKREEDDEESCCTPELFAKATQIIDDIDEYKRKAERFEHRSAQAEELRKPDEEMDLVLRIQFVFVYASIILRHTAIILEKVAHEFMQDRALPGMTKKKMADQILNSETQAWLPPNVDEFIRRNFENTLQEYYNKIRRKCPDFPAGIPYLQAPFSTVVAHGYPTKDGIWDVYCEAWYCYNMQVAEKRKEALLEQQDIELPSTLEDELRGLRELRDTGNSSEDL